MNYLDNQDDLDRLERDLGPRLRATFDAYLGDFGKQSGQDRRGHTIDETSGNDEISGIDETSGPQSGTRRTTDSIHDHRDSERVVPIVDVASRSNARHRWWAAAAAFVLLAGTAGVWGVARFRAANTAGRSDQVATGQGAAPGTSDDPIASDTSNSAPTNDPTSDDPTSDDPTSDVTTAITTAAGAASTSSKGPGDGTSVAVGDLRDMPDNSKDDYYFPPWDPIAVAPGTIGWFEAGDNLPAEIAALRPEGGEDPTRLAGEFRCRTWEVAADKSVTCTGLGGGNGVEQVDYGDRLGVGVQLGDTTAAEHVWAQAQGSLWGYDEVTEPPEPTVIDIAGTTGYSYRVGDAAYLAWEYQPGVVVWLHSDGIDDGELAATAAGVKPVQLPATMALPLELEPPAPGAINLWSDPPLVAGYVNGQLCVSPFGADRCAVPDQPALFVGQDWLDGLGAGYVSATVPHGLAATVRINVYETGWREVVPTATDLGFDVATWRPDGERVLEVQLVDADGNVIAETGELRPMGLDDSSTIAEGRTQAAWIVKRQTEGSELDGFSYTPTNDRNAEISQTPYCLLLFGARDFSPLCPPEQPPTTGLGQHADYHENLDLVEIASDVTAVRCQEAEMPIFADPQLDGRRFAVTTCDDPAIE